MKKENGKKTKKSSSMNKAMSAVSAYHSDGNIPTDVLGSYTGNPTLGNGKTKNKYERPVQDQDDL